MISRQSGAHAVISVAYGVTWDGTDLLYKIMLIKGREMPKRVLGLVTDSP